MNKRITSVILVVMLLISMGTFLVGAVDRGNTKSFTKSIKALNNNTYIQSVIKDNVNAAYSAIKIDSESELSEMNVWVMTSQNDWMSEKHLVSANDSITRIYYYNGTTFTEGASVCFWGEQDGWQAKAISGKLYSY